jgi:hypothetical protein
MRLFRVCPNASDKYSPQTYKPEEGIALGFVHNVPRLTTDHYAWVIRAMEDKGIDIACHILPVVLKEATNAELQSRIGTREINSNPVFLKNASLHQSSEGVNFLKEEEYIEDQNIIVSLELPLSAAQPYYEFEGDTEVLLGVFATYYGKNHEIEKEEALCSAIVRMGNKSKVSVTYTNRHGTGIQVENIVGQEYKFICSDGQLKRLNDCNFQNLFSSFMVNKEE